jgi:hypothetical protein
MTDSARPGQALDCSRLGEMISNQAKPAFGVEALPIEGNNTRRFLSAVLQSMKTKRSDCRCIRMAKNSKYAAFFS